MHRSSQDLTPTCPAETFPDFTGKRLRSETIREVFAVNSSRNPLKYKHYSQCVFYLQFERGKVVGNAVFSELVSGQNSLLTGNFTEKNRNFGLFRTVF